MEKMSNGGSAKVASKVALVGAHGTGKTTLTKHVKGGWKDGLALRVETTPEIPRLICSTAGDAEYFRRANNTVLKQCLLLVGQPIYETMCSVGSDLLLCDRSLLDHWAYTRALYGGEIPDDIRHVLDSLVRQHMASYSLVAYVPIEFPAQDDGTRESDPVFQASIDDIIYRSLLEWDLSFIELRGSVEERSASLVRHISRLF